VKTKKRNRLGLHKVDKETFVSEALGVKDRLADETDPASQFQVWTEEDEKLGSLLEDVRLAVTTGQGSLAPRQRRFLAFMEEWESPLIVDKAKGEYPRRVLDKYFDIIFFDDEVDTNYKVVGLEWNRKQWRVTSVLVKLEEGENNKVVEVEEKEGEDLHEVYEINHILHDMVLASKLNKGVVFITSQ
jgi:hypothetical protein